MNRLARARGGLITSTSLGLRPDSMIPDSTHSSGELFFSQQNLLSGLRQLQCQQPPRRQRGAGQQDGHHLGDANEGGEDGAPQDGGQLADGVQNPERCGSAGREEQLLSQADLFELLWVVLGQNFCTPVTSMSIS